MPVVIGILDSGSGGLLAARYVEGLTDEEIVFFPDRRNAPYGTKTRNELIRLVEDGIEALVRVGCDKVLVACCTAGTVCDSIRKEYRQHAFPIIEPTVEAALAATKNRRIAVLATEATVLSGCFTDAIKRKGQFRGVNALAVAAQPLVGIVEGGARDGLITDAQRAILKKVLSPLFGFDADTVILGCTHFPALSCEIKDILEKHGAKHVISSVKEGSDAFLLEHRGASVKALHPGKRSLLSIKGESAKISHAS